MISKNFFKDGINHLKNISFSFLSFGNKTDQKININFNNSTFKEIKEEIKSEFEECNFDKAFKKISQKKESNPDFKIDLMLLEISFLIDLFEINKAKDKLNYLKNNYLSSVKEKKEYYELDFSLLGNIESKEALINEYNYDKNELEAIYSYNIGNYKEYEEFIEKENIENEELPYIRNNLKKFTLEDFRNLIRKEKLKKVSLRIEILNKAILIQSLLEKQEDLLDEEFKVFFLEYEELIYAKLKIGKNFQFEKYQYGKEIFNIYLESKKRKIKTKSELLNLLEENKNTLNSSNKMELAILKNNGYRNLIDEINKNKIDGEAEYFCFRLFFNEKHKYLLHLIRKYPKLKENENIYFVGILSEVILKSKISDRGIEMLKKYQNTNTLAKLFLDYSFYIKKHIEKEEFLEKLESFFKIKYEDEIVYKYFIKIFYLVDKDRLIKFIIENKDNHYLVALLFFELEKDSELISFQFNRVIKEIDLETNNCIDFEVVGDIYTQFNNKKKGLEHYLKAWKKEQKNTLCDKIISLSLMGDEYNQSIFEYKENNKKTLRDEFMLSWYLKNHDYVEGCKRVNIFLLKNLKKLEKENIVPLLYGYHNKILKKSKLDIYNLLYKEKEQYYMLDFYKKFIQNQNVFGNDIKYKNKYELGILVGKVKQEDKLEYIDKFIVSKIVMDKKNIEKYKLAKILKTNLKTENILEAFEQITGEKKIKEKRSLYIEKNQGSISEFCHSFYHYERLVEDILYKLNLSKLSKNYNSENKKLLSLESILIFSKLDFFKLCKYDKNIYIQESVFLEIKQKALDEKNEFYQKVLDDILIIVKDENRVINDMDYCDLVKRKDEQKAFDIPIMSYVYNSLIEYQCDYITEDYNPILSQHINCSSLAFIIFSLRDKIEKEDVETYEKFIDYLLRLESNENVNVYKII